jgi:hypothetical protein
MLEAALIWKAAGFSPIPGKSTKAPATGSDWQKYSDAPLSNPSLTGYLAAGQYTVYGLACGYNGAVMLEVEERAVSDLFDIDDALAAGSTDEIDLTEVWQRVTTYQETSRSGGKHWLIRVVDANGAPVRVGNHHLAKMARQPDGTRPVLWEHKGYGGFTVMAPSYVDTGSWTIDHGEPGVVGEITSDEWECLCAAITAAFNQGEALAVGDRIVENPEATPAVIAEWKAANTIDAILVGAGWTRVDGRGDNGSTYLRPGGSATGASCSGQIVGGLFYCYSTSAGLPVHNDSVDGGANGLDAWDLGVAYGLCRMPEWDPANFSIEGTWAEHTPIRGVGRQADAVRAAIASGVAMIEADAGIKNPEPEDLMESDRAWQERGKKLLPVGVGIEDLWAALCARLVVGATGNKGTTLRDVETLAEFRAWMQAEVSGMVKSFTALRPESVSAEDYRTTIEIYARMSNQAEKRAAGGGAARQPAGFYGHAVKLGNEAELIMSLRQEIGRSLLGDLFIRNGKLVRIPWMQEDGAFRERVGGDGREHDGALVVVPVNGYQLAALVDERYEVLKFNDETLEWEAATFPSSVSMNIVAAVAEDGTAASLRGISGIVTTPFLAPGARVVWQPGHDAETRIVMMEAMPGWDGVTLYEGEDEAEEKVAVLKALSRLLKLTTDFPFKTTGHRANYLGALMWPALRQIIPAPFPMLVLSAPTRGTGKTLLAQMLVSVHGGSLGTLPPDETEMKKHVTSVLLSSTACVQVFDNVRGQVKSPTLEGLTTAANWSDRILGVSATTTLANDRLWVITSNNAILNGDMDRRALPVLIDSGQANPHLRGGYKIPDLEAYVAEHRAQILADVLAIGRGWLRAGAPREIAGRSDSYGNLVASLRGMFGWLNSLVGREAIGEFWAAEDFAVSEEMDAEAMWLEALYEASEGKRFEASDVVSWVNTGKVSPDLMPAMLVDSWMNVRRSGFGEIQAGGAVKFVNLLGQWFGYRKNSVLGDCTLVPGTRVKNQRGWQVRKV